MVEDKIKVFSEALARAVDRRTFLKRTGSSLVAGLAAMVMGPLLTKSSAAAAVNPLAVPNISCNPPGPYCNTGGGDTSGCRGGHCYQHLSSGTLRTCEVYYTFYTTGCWTTAVSGGYWTCCDCSCSGSGNPKCGCASFNPSVTPSNNPSPH